MARFARELTATLMEALLSPQALADLLGVPIATVYNWNYRGLGPQVLHVGRHVRYRPADIEKWLVAQEVD